MYGGVNDGQPFDVFVRQDSSEDLRVVIKFECKEGMGVLGIRKVGRIDPAPSGVYQEADVEPASLRAGRFVHVMSSGQRQSYALSRLTEEVAARLPSDAWILLKPHTEYGFRYLVVPEEKLLSTNATASAAVVASAASVAAVVPAPPAAAAASGSVGKTMKPAPVSLPPNSDPVAGGASVPAPVPMAPALAEAALAGLTQEAAVAHLRAEMAKVAQMQAEVGRLTTEIRRSHERERDLVALLGKWRDA
jgi:hypothetical protein